MYSIAIALLSYGSPELDAAAFLALDLAALDAAASRLAAHAEWSSLVSDLVAIGAT